MASLFSAIKYMDENDRKNPDIPTLVSMNQHVAERGFCVSKHKGTPIICRCLEVLSQEEYYCTAVANYQMTVMSLEKYKQQRIVVEWLRHHRRHPSHKSKYTFRMPFYVAKDDSRAYQDLREAFICHNAMLDIYLLEGMASGRNAFNIMKWDYFQLTETAVKPQITTKDSWNNPMSYDVERISSRSHTL